MRITKDPDIRREEIINAALALFREEGFEKVSVESIAKKAGIAKGSIYNYFKTKESVYEAVIAAISFSNLSATEEILSDKRNSPKERLTQYIDWSFRLNEQQQKSLSRVLATEASSSQRQMYMKAFDEGINRLHPIFENVMAEGVESGEFSLVDPSFTAVVLLGAFRGIHIAFYNGLQIDMETGRVYLYDFLSRLLGTSF